MMELWSQVIVEWVNCLDVSETSIKDIEQLHSEKCYEKLINLLSWKPEEASRSHDIVTEFIKNEYPQFQMEDNENKRDTNNVYIGSLLLLYLCQESSFQKPMCAKLQHETQIKIKTFLELVLPYGKNITSDVLHEALTELGDSAPKTPLTTQRMQLLKEFFNSPASRSAQSLRRTTEPTHELRQLRIELETERFEKIELQDDLEVQQKKIQSLQKKLQEKTDEVKLLQEEHLKSATPQSCKKHKNMNHYETVCRKEVDRLEHELLYQHREMNKLEEEKDSVLNKLTTLEQQYNALKVKCTSYESSVESLLLQIEFMDRELKDVKKINEALCTDFDEVKKKSFADKSYEGDSFLIPPSPKTGEVLSSVVDLQLQEVKRESNVLKTQFEAVNKQLECIAQENNCLKEVNNVLQSSIERLTPYVEENARLKEVAIKKNILEEEVIKLKNIIVTNSKFLSCFSTSLTNFDTEVHTKLEHVFNKLCKSAERVSELEQSKVKLQCYYETKINLLNADTHSLKLEKEELVHDLHNVHNTYELLQEEANNMSVQIKSKDAQMEELSSKINSLEHEIIRYTSEKQQTKREFDDIKVQLESTNAALEYTRKENNRLLEANNVLQEDCRNMMQCREEENTHLKKVLKQNNKLEQEVLELQHTILAKDKVLSSLSVTLENFGTDMHTKMVHISKKLDISTQHIKELENSKNKLQEYYESRLSVLNDDTQNTKLEQTKLVHDLQETNNNQKLLREEVENMNIQIKTKDEKIEALNSEVKMLEDEVLNSLDDLHNARKECDTLNEQLKSMTEQMKSKNDENSHIQETLKLLQNDFKNLMELKKENAILKEIRVQKCTLEEDIMRLQESLTTKDKFLSNLTLSLKTFRDNIHTKLEEVSNKLDFSSKRIKDLEESKRKLQEYYESKINLLSSKMQNANLEQTKLLLDLQKMTDTHDQLQAKADGMSVQIKCKNVETQSLCSEIKSLKDEILKSTASLREAKVGSDTLKTQLESTSEELNFLDKNNNKLKETISILQRKLEKMEIQLEKKTCLNEIVVQKSVLEKEIDISHLSMSSDNLDSNAKDISDKLEQSAQRVKGSDIKNDLEKYDESSIKQENFDSQNFKLERDKLLGEIHKINEEHKHLQKEIINMTTAIELKDEEIRALCSEIKCLKIECEHLTSSAKQHELLRCSRERLESQLLDKQHLLDQANEDIQEKEEALEVLHSEIVQLKSENVALQEKKVVELDLKNNILIQEKLLKTSKELHTSTDPSITCENNLKSDELKHLHENELRLQSQVDCLVKEKREFKDKLDKNRARCAKLETHLAELRNERMKTAQECTSLSSDVENLKLEVARLNKERAQFAEKIENLSKRPNEEDFSDRLKDVHETYKEKLDEIKKKMKMVYNEQVTKLNKTHSVAIQKNVNELRSQMEQQCRKHTEEISKYKAHVGELNKQFWHAAEKLLTEQQQKQEALQRLNELKVKFQALQFDVTQTQSAGSKQQKCFKLDKTDFLAEDSFLENIRTIRVTQEEIHERRHSMRSIQTIGNAFKTADEEGEVFDNTYLTDMKEGYCLPAHDVDRLSVLQQRNSLYLPHLKSSYPAEMQFYPASFNEEDIKTGSVPDETFNDSLSQSLLPEQKTRKKDRSQTSYRKHGPPTPSKNGRRLSLQGSGHRSPAFRTLRERNGDRRTTTTPRVFKQIFNMKRQDTSAPGTPKRRISNIFRKARVTERQQKL